MNILIDQMCKKRLCLPSNDDFSKSYLCECGNSHHIACVIRGKDR